MADPVLHIKDSYYFEVPKVLCPASYQKRQDFPEVWISLDPDFQDWEFHRLYRELTEALQVKLPPKAEVLSEWHHWQHADHENFAKPLDVFLDERYWADVAAYRAWKASQVAAASAAKSEADLKTAQELTLKDYLHSADHTAHPYTSFSEHRDTREFQTEWAAARKRAGNVAEYNADPGVPDWSKEKLEAYNYQLSGKVLIPQPFGDLRNLHEAESSLISQDTAWINYDNFGFCISKFMVIEVGIGLVLILLFSWLARRLTAGGSPRGKTWNLLEVFVVFIRDQIARPALDGHHGEEHGHEGHAEPEAKVAPAHVEASHGHASPAPAHKVPHSHAPAAHAHEMLPSQRYTPVLCTIFFFILGCNLCGMLPWVGAPTGTWAVTLALAVVTLLTGFIGGVREFGVVGYFLNQIPGMDLTWYMALFLKPIIFVIEIGGLLIKHAVLSVRLLANMLAGHMVLLAIMGLAFGTTAAMTYVAPDGSISPMWWVASISSIIGCTLLSMLELFVAFLQAYVFTLLSALFIGAAIHKH